MLKGRSFLLKRLAGAGLAGGVFLFQGVLPPWVEAGFWEERKGGNARRVEASPELLLAQVSLSIPPFNLPNLPGPSDSAPNKLNAIPGPLRAYAEKAGRFGYWGKPVLDEKPGPMVVIIQDIHGQTEAQE